MTRILIDTVNPGGQDRARVNAARPGTTAIVAEQILSIFDHPFDY
jgi:hypothetical protein